MADEVIKKLNQHDEQLEIIASTVLDNKERLDKITDVVVDNQGRLERVEENMVTKQDHQEVMGALDKLIGMSEKKEQELIFMGERVKCVESKATKNTVDIQKIKPLVGLGTN